jgi:hypothetical protein
MTERSEVIIKLSPPGQGASSQPATRLRRAVRTSLYRSEEAS